jgi:hypothetical protein
MGYEGIQFIDDPDYANLSAFYFFSQWEVLLFCHEKYGNTTLDLKKNFTLDDKVRLAESVSLRLLLENFCKIC